MFKKQKSTLIIIGTALLLCCVFLGCTNLSYQNLSNQIENTETSSANIEFGITQTIKLWQFIFWFLSGSVVFLLIMVITLIRNRKLQQEIILHKSMEEISRKRFSQTARSANMGLWNYYPQEDKIEVNPVWCTQLGYEPDELRETTDEWSVLKGGTSKWMDLMHPDDKQRVADRLGDYFTGEAENYSIEFRLRCKDGEYIWVLGAGSFSKYDENGNPLQMDGTHISVNELKKVQHELILARDEAEEASRVKSEFLANMSHEIRTPMNAVIGLSDLLWNTNLTNKQRYYVDKLSQSSKNLLNIINEILDFSKLESGMLPIEEIEFRIDDVLSELSTIVSHRAFEKNIELLVYKDPEIPDVLLGDPFRLEQSLLNITGNAVKFTDDGEVLVAVELIEISDKAKLKFSIVDTGIGMSEEQIENLFLAFEQADASTTRKYGGTGLGLTISKNLINLMGGEIEVKSRLGEGSQFQFTLEFDVPKESTIRSLEAISRISNLKILAVEDNITAQFILKNYLSSFINEPVIVSTGEAAIKQCNEQFFDVVILDCEMPGLDGIEVWKRISGMDNLQDAVAILMTSYGMEEVDRKAHEAGFSSVLTKPFTKIGLFSAIARLFDDEFTEEAAVTHIEDYPKGFDQIRGAKILLAEDDKINQLVAKDTLTSEGFLVDIANNGAAVVEMAKISDYDIILMDLQMPVMDGYQSARTIRSNVTSSVPIVALSADVLHGVREKALTAGMDDYLSKPIERQELFKILVKWIEPKERDIVKTMDKYDDSITADYLNENIKDINVDEGLNRLSGNINLYITLLKKYSVNYAYFFDELNEDIKNKNHEKAIKDVHMLKGVTANLSMNTLNEVLVKLQNDIKNEDFAKAEKHIAKGEKIHKRVIAQVKSVAG